MQGLRSGEEDQLRNIARRVMQERGLVPEFPPDAVAQAAAIEGPASDAAATLRDLRDLPWVSIDNDDSRDLDQLTVARDVPGGATTILVAIADVDATVAVGTPLDVHAQANTTSVYTAAGIFPMLPEKLSTDLTSLVQDAERLSIVIEFTVASDGAVRSSDIYRALVRNRAKLAYDSVAAWLDGHAAPPARVTAVQGMDAQLRTQDRVAQALRKMRHVHGALDLDTLEVRAVFENGVLSDLRPDAKNRAKALIEDLMIAANGVTARFLAARGCSSLRRVLRLPERWQRIVDLAKGLGHDLPPAPDAQALAAFLVARRTAAPAQFGDLSLSIVKLMGSGEYALERPGETGPGHFGLAVTDYTHSTAPNRRFPDVIAQRLVKAALDGRPAPYADEALTALAAHCTTQEDNAEKVERQVRKSAAALLLGGRIGQRFDAIVTGASPKGTWVRIAGPAVEGRVVHGYDGLDVGDACRVELIHVDVSRGFIDFKRVGSNR